MCGAELFISGQGVQRQRMRVRRQVCAQHGGRKPKRCCSGRFGGAVPLWGARCPWGGLVPIAMWVRRTRFWLGSREGTAELVSRAGRWELHPRLFYIRAC